MSEPRGQQPQYNPYGPGGQVPTLRPEAKPKRRKKWPFVVGGFVLLFVIIGLANGGNSTTGTTAAPGATAAQPLAAAPAGSKAVAPLQPAAPAAEPAVPAASPPTTYTGEGDDVVTITKDSGPAIVTFECPKCSANTVLQSDGYESLLVNEIGSYTGRHLIDAGNGSTTSTLTVQATGSWKITVASGLDSATMGDTAASGHGDDVVLLRGTTSKAAITNKGSQSNFVVQVYPAGSSYPDLAVNTIGGYSGTVPVDGPAVLAITSTGDWSVTGS